MVVGERRHHECPNPDCNDRFTEGEIKFAVLQEQILNWGKATEEQTTQVAKLLEILQNGTAGGLVTRVALLQGEMRRSWWWLGAVSVAILGAAAKWLFG